MTIWELIIIAIGLSMDAFAVSVCKGLSVKKAEWKHSLAAGIYFGAFQALMPLIGYFVGIRFKDLICEFDHWIAFVLLVLIGANMIKEAFGKEEKLDCDFGFKSMFPLAIATSIDALAVGVTFAFLNVNIAFAVSIIGVITLAVCMIGIKIGNIFGEKYKSKAEFAGGLILIVMGVKILIEHLFF